MAEYMEGITVIVPVYNVKDYLAETLESYINQSMKNTEIILVDDGSTDGSGVICDEYALQYDRIKVFHTKNSGVSEARNYAIHMASYDYLVFWDADDYIENNALEEMYASVIRDDCDLVICGYYMESVIKEKVRRIPFSMSQNELLLSFEEFHKLELWDNSLMYNVWNKLYRKKLIQENQIYFHSMPLGEDLEFNMRYLEYCKKIATLSNCYYHYMRGRTGAATGSYINDWFMVRNEEHMRLLAYFSRHSIKNEAIMEFINRHYIERILGCIENEFHQKNISTLRSKKRFIKSVVENELVEKSLKLMKPKSKKVAIMIIPLKMKWVILIYLMGATIARIKRTFPQWYIALKAAR